MKCKRLTMVALAALSLWLGSLAAWAQTSATGAVRGTITDSSGAVVPGTEITLVNNKTGEKRTGLAGDDGAYRIPLLPPGSYRVEARQTGFKTAAADDLPVVVSEWRTLNLQMQVGAANETVLVQGAGELVQTATPAMGRVANQDVVANLPLSARNFTQIAALSPGITMGVTNAADGGRGTGGLAASVDIGFTANGNRNLDNTYQINGVEANDFQSSSSTSGGVAIPNPDTIQEFKVQTAQYDASFGRSTGANVSIITKGGSKDFHSTLFEFFRNEVLNANDFFINRAGQAKPLLRQHQFGYTVSGPVVPEKLLFFNSYEGTRQDNGQGATSNVSVFSPPLTDDRSRQALGTLFGGQTGAFGGVAVAPDGSNIHPAALALLQLKKADGTYVIPTPQKVDPSLPFASRGFSAYSIPAEYNENQYMFNLDFLHTNASSFSARFFLSDAERTSPFGTTNVPGFTRSTDFKFRNTSLGHTFVFGPRTLNEARFGWHYTSAPAQPSTSFRWSDIGVTANPDYNSLVDVNISGSHHPSTSFPVNFTQNTYTMTDAFSMTRGRHQIRIGGGLVNVQDDLKLFQFQAFLIFLSYPDFLLGLDSSQNGSPLSNVFGSIDFLGKEQREVRVWDSNLYIQDDIRINRRLTLNLGLRYERFGGMADRLGRMTTFDVSKANANPPAGGTLEGYVVPTPFDGQVPTGVTQVDSDTGSYDIGKNNLSPRFGFAWQALPDSNRFVLRGGWGLYNGRMLAQQILQGIFGPPFVQFRQLTGALNTGANLSDPFPKPPLKESDFPIFFPYSPTSALTQTIYDPYVRPSRVHQMSLNLQTLLASDLLLEVGYVGARGTKLSYSRNLNQAILASASNPIRGVTTNTVANIPLRVPIQGFAPENGIRDVGSGAGNWYNSMQVSLTKRFGKGLQFLGSYTWQRALDDLGGATHSSAIGGAPPGNQETPGVRWGRSDMSRDQRFVLSFLYDVPNPVADSSSKFLKGFLGGWSLSGVVVYQSGLPLSILGTNGTNAYGITADNAQFASGCTHEDLVTSGSVNSKVSNYFNKACVAPWPVIGSDGRATDFGNIGPTVVNGPDQRNWDFALVKRTRLGLGEHSNLEFRAEFFNAFNTTQFGSPNNNSSQATYGTITRVSVAPRIIQFALKLNF